MEKQPPPPLLARAQSRALPLSRSSSLLLARPCVLVCARARASRCGSSALPRLDCARVGLSASSLVLRSLGLPARHHVRGCRLVRVLACSSLPCFSLGRRFAPPSLVARSFLAALGRSFFHHYLEIGASRITFAVCLTF